MELRASGFKGFRALVSAFAVVGLWHLGLPPRSAEDLPVHASLAGKHCFLREKGGGRARA